MTVDKASNSIAVEIGEVLFGDYVVRLTLVDNLRLPPDGTLACPDLQPHLGLISLAAVTNEGGHCATVWAPTYAVARGEVPPWAGLYEESAQRLIEQQPDAVGFTTLGSTFLYSINVIKCLKQKAPDLPILMGGPHATILHREILERWSTVDVVVRHEAEDTILPVLDALSGARDLHDIPGVSFRSGDQVVVNDGTPTVQDLDALPAAAYHCYPIEELGLETIHIDAGRGCPFSCTFCSTASFFGRSYRLKSPARLVRDMDTLHERYGFTDFGLTHDLFTVNETKVRAFCEAVKPRGYTWRCSARVDCVDEDLIRTMRDSGCRSLYFGIETGSRRMQKLTEKKLDLDLVEPTVRLTESLGMRTTLSFVAGYPEESQEDLDQTLDLLGASFDRGDDTVWTELHMLTPEPGTKLFSEWGHLIQYDGYSTSFNASKLQDGDERLIREIPEVLLCYYHYPPAISRARLRIVVDVYRALRKCGHVVQRYALCFYEHRLSQLIGRVCDWAESAELRTSIGPWQLVDFFASEHGREHHLTSLVAYMSISQPYGQTLPNARRAKREAAYDADTIYEIGAQVFLFPRIHDCRSLIERIREDVSRAEPFDESDVGEPHCRLVVGPRTQGDEVHDFALDPEEVVLARMLRKPRSHRELVRALGLPAMDPLPGTEFLAKLVDIGALLPVRERSSRTPSTRAGRPSTRAAVDDIVGEPVPVRDSPTS